MEVAIIIDTNNVISAIEIWIDNSGVIPPTPLYKGELVNGKI